MAPRFSKNGKRLGRPPKNPTAQAANPVVFKIAEEVANTPDEPIVIDEESMIECEFVPIPQYGLISNSNSEKKLGVYSSCVYSDIEELNWTEWIVKAYLKADFQKYRKMGLSDVEILKRCFNFLNATAPRKKYAKKDPVPKYGKLKLINEVRFTDKFGFESAVTIFTTTERKCKFFWSEGEKRLQ